MKSSRKRSTAGTIAFSVIVASLLLAAATWFFVYWVIPAYELDPAVIYSLFIRLLPLLIGLTVLQIGVILSIPTTKDEADSKDILLRDSFDDPLYILPDEDPPVSSISPFKTTEPIIAPPPVVATVAQPIQRPATKIERPSPPVTTYTPPPAVPAPMEPLPEDETHIETTAAMESMPVPQAEPTQIIQPEKTVEMTSSETEIPSPSAYAPEGSDIYRPPLTQAVDFSDYPYPIEAGSDIAQLLQPLPETQSLDDPLLLNYQGLVKDTFTDRLDSEIESALENGYDLTIGIITLPGAPDNPLDINAGVTQYLFHKLDSMSFFYVLDEQHLVAIIPFYKFKTARYYFAALLESMRKTFLDSTVTIGFSSLHDRTITRETLFQEAEIASSWAQEQGGLSLIGYESDNNEDSATD
jgi:hypothetical protein